jgi:hypothetical protein
VFSDTTTLYFERQVKQKLWWVCNRCVSAAPRADLL